MNFTLKTLVAAATLVAAGSANAALVGAATGDGELALYVWDTVSKATFVMDLPNQGADQFTAHSIQTSASTTWNVATAGTSANWTNFLANVNAAGNPLVWAVYGADSKINVAAGETFATPGAVVTAVTVNINDTYATDVITNGNLVNSSKKDATMITKVNAGANSSVVDPTFFGTVAGTTGNTAEGLVFGGANNLGNTSVVASNSTADVTSDFLVLTGASDATGTAVTTITKIGTFTFNLSTATLAWNAIPVTTNVPESDTYAMLMAGLGVMGFVARRRLAA